jgi:hypothetical protein
MQTWMLILKTLYRLQAVTGEGLYAIIKLELVVSNGPKPA